MPLEPTNTENHAVKLLQSRLEKIYSAEIASDLTQRLIAELNTLPDGRSSSPKERLWNQDDVLLITYGDSIRQGQQLPLRTLCQFLRQTLEWICQYCAHSAFFPI